ncbi:hypothetical protein CS542_01650 [Pedobacter sp. IW39]|nr:hypothetical protein CS542_01650 [Pedobacter sp. IW39]
MLEDEIADWFEAQNVENGYAIAESFVDFNFSVADLESVAPVAEHLSRYLTGSVICWLQSGWSKIFRIL